MFIARDSANAPICARCGGYRPLTIDHFVPRCCGMNVNSESNYVGLCFECNQEKKNTIVCPSWYTYLKEEQQQKLRRVMRYARSWIQEHVDDEEILRYIREL